ncbi:MULTISPECIES: carboxymuconolactone decarboxylase family protein [Streptomyces]|uniref:Uncharacterized protein n=1 Tax=Streptomyces doebereineriae TaxID=3075528 RepID=A0ABU2VRA2_9ACTN|nr:hypothetical protein [Streptomyces sp. DSM 41640]MDT0488148.1 hypothetical protein [Streptomyces sp. DSM 41640]
MSEQIRASAPARTRRGDFRPDAAREVLSEDQISAAIWMAITIGAFNRVSIMNGHPVQAPRGARAQQSIIDVSSKLVHC